MAKNPHHSSMGEANTLRQIPLHQGPITSAMWMWKYCRTEERVADMLTKDRIEIDLRNCDGWLVSEKWKASSPSSEKEYWW